MILWTFQLLFLGSPVLLAAIAHGLIIRYDVLSFLTKPLDFGLHFRRKRLFGNNKTWRGLAVHVAFCTLGATVQGWFQEQGITPRWLLLFDYTKQGPLVGLLLGLGMTLGELPNSFLKRQLDIPPGQRASGLLGVLFLVFDQVDLTLGIWVLFCFIMKPPALLILWSLAMTLGLHLAISALGFILKMRKTIF